MAVKTTVDARDEWKRINWLRKRNLVGRLLKQLQCLLGLNAVHGVNRVPVQKENEGFGVAYGVGKVPRYGSCQG